MISNRFSLLFMVCLLGATLFFTACNSASSAAPTDFNAVLMQSWQFYKSRFMPNQERVVSETYKGTITEGQSYALLKSVWMNDRPTFDKVWQWTDQHMRRHSDHLFSWQWGEVHPGQFGIIGNDSATDGDEDIAYALLLAGEKWHQPAYTAQALPIIQDLWRISVVNLHGKLYLSSGTWEGFRQGLLTVDPSYFAPYVYRKFAEYDKSNATGWLALSQSVYQTLNDCSNLTALKLPPNFCGIRWDTNQVVFSDTSGPSSRNFSYDAFRVFWRMAMDANLNGEGGRRYLQTHTALINYWNQHHTLPEGFSPTGVTLKGDNPSGFALSALLAQRHVLNPLQDQASYQSLLAPYYHQEGYWFNSYNDFLHSTIWLHLYTLKSTS